MTTPSRPQPCILLRFNHFDPLWRRCWDRSFTDNGRRYASYREIETAWIDDAIKSSDDGESCFMVEATWVVRHYLDLRPNQLHTLRRLARAGQFELLASGENIIDTNMVHGELLVRNLVLGLLWAKETLGVLPTVGWMSDDFGSSAQVPQIFRGCGVRWVPAISYNTPDAPYWRGLDGSIVFYEVKNKLAHRMVCGASTYRKHPPCSACRGMGCDVCFGRGFDAGPRAEFTRPPAPVAGADAIVAMLWGEEILPGMNIVKDVAAFNASQNAIVVRQGVYRDLELFIQKELASVDNPPAALISSKVENNPSQSGCYVTRIKIKQGHREAENALLTAEKLDTILRRAESAGKIREMWRNLTLGAFHDSITSSHVDPAYDELIDLFNNVKLGSTVATQLATSAWIKPAQQSVAVFNPQSFEVSTPVTAPLPTGWQNTTIVNDAGVSVPTYEVSTSASGTSIRFLASSMPGLSFSNYTFAPAASAVQALGDRKIQFEDFEFELGDRGIIAITHGTLGPIVKTDQFLVGELVLENDLGDPWATRSFDRARTRLSPFTKLVDVVRENDSLAITFTGRHPSTDDPHFCADPNVTILEWTQVFRLRKSVPWIDVSTKVNWHTHSRRLRIMFPSVTCHDRGVYDVPFGTVERNRYEAKTNHGGSAGGDWPALHWAGVTADNHTLAIFNAGTPSYRIEDGVITVSVLRSPQLPYGLYEPQWYAVHNYHGMMDHGQHSFRHAIYAAPGAWQDNDITRQAAVFNSPSPVFAGRADTGIPQWGLQADYASIAAIKTAEDAQGVVLRIAESSGKQAVVNLKVPDGFDHAWLCNMLEEPQSQLVKSAEGFTLNLKAWEIVTVRVS